MCLENKRIQSQEKVDAASIIASGRHTDSYLYMLETKKNQQGQTIIERAMRQVFMLRNRIVRKTLTVLYT